MTSSNVRRRRPNHTAKMSRTLIDLAKMAAVVAVLVFAVILVIRLTERRAEPAADTFCEGVYVNGISLGGLTREEGQKLVQEDINRRLNEDSYLLTYKGQQWVFTPSEFEASLDLSTEIALAWNFGHVGTAQEKREQAESIRENPIYYEKDISYNTVLLDDFLLDIKQAIDVEPVNADLIVGTDENITVVPSSDGLSLSLDGLRSTLRNAIMRGEATTIELEPEVIRPAYTAEGMTENMQLVATYRTKTTASSYNRTRNIKRALNSFNGRRIDPGETISFNAVVGKRTKANGFYESPEYDGTTVINGIGGGTCQASTTLYGALLLADIDVVLRSSHSMTVNYVKPSLDAAVNDLGTKDLRFTNFSDYPYVIYTSVDTERAEVKIYGQPSPYDIKLEYEVLADIKPKGYKTRKDKTGKHAFYTTDLVLSSEGKDGMKSKGYRAYYDKTTGELIERVELSSDTYYASQPIYWVGVNEPEF